MRKFGVFDIDGTLIRWQLYHAVADRLVKLGTVEASEFESIRSARMDWKRRSPNSSFKTYENELIKAYEVALKKITTKQLEQAVESVFEEYKDQVYVYTRRLIEELKEKGCLLFAISGSQSEIIEKIAEHYGFESYLGTVYERAGDRFTGQKVFHAHHKDEALKKLIKTYHLDLEDSYGVGDSASDIAMLEMVANPIAFNPESELFTHSRANGWKIVVERKNMVYELEEKDGSYILA